MSQMTAEERIGLDHLTLAGVSPPDLISAAAQAGARNVSLHLRNNVNPMNLPAFSLLEDAALRRETARRAADLGVAISLAEGFVVLPGQSVEQHRRGFDILGELGCTRVNSLSLDTSWERTKDEMAALGVIAAEYGVTVNIESFRRSIIASLARAKELLDHAGLPNIRLMVDTMHVTRSGEADSFLRIDPGLFGYVQISDGPFAEPDDEAYQKESLYNRQIPGEGEMPLVAMMRHVPADVIVSAEVPQTRRRQAGESDVEIARSVVAGIRKVLAAAAS